MTSKSRKIALGKAAGSSRQQRVQVASKAGRISADAAGDTQDTSVTRKGRMRIGTIGVRIFRTRNRRRVLALEDMLELVGLRPLGAGAVISWLEIVQRLGDHDESLTDLIEQISNPLPLNLDTLRIGGYRKKSSVFLSVIDAKAVVPFARCVALRAGDYLSSRTFEAAQERAMIFMRALAIRSLENRIDVALGMQPNARWETFRSVATDALQTECPRLAARIPEEYFAAIYRLHGMHSNILTKAEMIEACVQFHVRYFYDPLVAGLDGLMQHDGQGIVVRFNDGTFFRLEDFLLHEVGIEGVLRHVTMVIGISLAGNSYPNFAARMEQAFPVLGLRENLVIPKRPQRNKGPKD
ncbi:MAG: hypothetical protein H6918_05435 [Sphingomonadaceae bacterium]|nr:hypothetical protein [Sphingomonadaceae bacterium]